MEQGIDSIKEGMSYILEEEKPHYCFTLLAEAIKGESTGLCITRTNPTVLKKQYNLGGKVKILWLTDRATSRATTIFPSLESIMFKLENFIRTPKKGFLVIDGLEYLISNNEFGPVLSFVRQLKDMVSESNVSMVIPISPLSISSQQLKMLERELMIIKKEEEKSREILKPKPKEVSKGITTPPIEPVKPIAPEIEEFKIRDEDIGEKISAATFRCPRCGGSIKVKSDVRPITVSCEACKRSYTLLKKEEIERRKKEEVEKDAQIKCIYCGKDMHIKTKKRPTIVNCSFCNKMIVI